MRYKQRLAIDDRGQVTVLFVVVIVIGVASLMALATIGEAMVHRARARAAADMIVLSTTGEGQAASEVVGWYQAQGLRVETQPGYARVESGPSQAAAWASTTAHVDVAPVVVAIVARIEQLRGTTLTTVQWHQTSFEVSGADVATVRAVVAEFGLCTEPTSGGVRFEVC